MNRQIIFRGKSKETGEWIHGDLLNRMYCQKIGGYVVTPGTYSDPGGDTIYVEEEVIPETVGQFIGINDKNGNPIYEGDLVADSEEKYTIVFERCDFDDWSGLGWLLKNEKTSFFISPDDSPVLEIIGNIFDSPLLEKTT